MNTRDAVTALGALAQETRLAVFRALVKRGPQGYTPGDLSGGLKIPGPTLSFHLKELQRAGLVTCSREGRFLNYSASFTAVRELIGFLTEKCCALSDVERDGSCAPVAVRTKQRVRGID